MKPSTTTRWTEPLSAVEERVRVRLAEKRLADTLKAVADTLKAVRKKAKLEGCGEIRR